MKLTVDSVVNRSSDITISIDGYVPLDVKIIDSIGSPPLYWRVGNGKKSLLELAILPENGLLSAITLVGIDPDYVYKVDNIPVDLSDCEIGLAVVNLLFWKCCDMNDFSQRFIDDFDLDIQIFICMDSILIVINRDEGKVNWIRYSDKFYVGISSDRNMTHLFFDRLTQEKIDDFCESIR